MSIQIIKADGSHETFKVEKLRRSLTRAGASKDEIKDVVQNVEAILHNGMKTQENIPSRV